MTKTIEPSSSLAERANIYSEYSKAKKYLNELRDLLKKAERDFAEKEGAYLMAIGEI